MTKPQTLKFLLILLSIQVSYILPLSLVLNIKYTPLFKESQILSEIESNAISKAKAETNIVATKFELFLKNRL
jgi:hypothetical protein